MWQYNMNQNMLDLNRIERSIINSKYELIELPIGMLNYSGSPELGDEVVLVCHNKSRIKGVVMNKTEYSHFVLFTERYNSK